MGFPEPLARNALVLTRNRLHVAVEWALQRAGDPSAMAPLTDVQLLTVYGPGAVLAGSGGGGDDGGDGSNDTQAPILADPEGLQSLRDMGFPASEAERALAAFGGSVDAACQYLLSLDLAGSDSEDEEDEDYEEEDEEEEEASDGESEEDGYSGSEGGEGEKVDEDDEMHSPGEDSPSMEIPMDSEGEVRLDEHGGVHDGSNAAGSVAGTGGGARPSGAGSA
jgi:hypothetical protein